MSDVYTPHTPGLFDALTRIEPGSRGKWEAFLHDWRAEVKRLCDGQEPEPTPLQKLRTENHKIGTLYESDTLRPFTAIEEAFMLDKCRIWSAKQIAREMHCRNAIAVTSFLNKRGIRIRDRERWK